MQKYQVTISDNGTIHWRKNGKLHRDDGPALEYTNGDNFWYQDGYYHRDNGPAVETSDKKEWYQDGRRHREDGPAVEYANGDKEWYQNGKLLTEDEIINRSTTKELTVAEIQKLLGCKIKIIGG